jgi:hypothetical protein
VTRALGPFLLAIVGAAAPCYAQSPARMLFDVGAVFVGGASAGTSTATYTAPDGSLVPQFSLDKSIGPAIGVNSHLSIRVSSRAALEINALWARPELRTRLAGDTDGADNATATQSVDRFVVGGGASIRLKEFGRWRTFARASVGWLRELSSDQSLYQDGWNAQAGGGANFVWKEKRGHFRPYGIRTEVWVDIRHGGLTFAEKSRIIAPACSAAMIFKL